MFKRFLIKLLRKLTHTEPNWIKEVRVKVMFNPFEEKMYWVTLNPKTHVWNWTREADQDEIVNWYETVQNNPKADSEGIPPNQIFTERR